MKNGGEELSLGIETPGQASDIMFSSKEQDWNIQQAHPMMECSETIEALHPLLRLNKIQWNTQVLREIKAVSSNSDRLIISGVKRFYILDMD